MRRTEFQRILNFSMDIVRYVKSFSQGQITIPKEFRKAMGLKDNFWLKLSVDQGRIIVEPTEKETVPSSYLQKILTIKGNWLNLDEIKKNRTDIEKRVNKTRN